MARNKFIFLNFALFFIGFMTVAVERVNGQNTVRVSGVVRDAVGNTLSYVSISLRQPDSTIIGFTSTGSDGRYELAVPEFSGFICATALGYRQNCNALIIERGSAARLVDFVLTEEFRIIDEVNVEAKLGIRERGDTLVYRLEVFTNRTERNLEDALAKLPGFRIDEYGTISVNGQNIRKIMLENDDLTGENYKLVSKNLSADMISEVEVLNRYLDNPLHKGIIESEEVALNLKLKEDRKGVIFGDAEMAAGTGYRYKGLVNALVFTRAVKSYTLIKADNVGLEMTNPTIEAASPAILGTPFNPRPENRLLLNNGDVGIPSMGIRTKFNRGRLASLNLAGSVGDKISFKGNFHLGRDQVRSSSYSRSQLFSNKDTLTYDELNEHIKRPTAMTGSAEWLYKISNSSSMRFTSALQSDRTSEESLMDLDGQFIGYNQHSHQLYHRTYLNYTNRISNALLLEIQSIYMHNKLGQHSLLYDRLTRETHIWMTRPLQQDYRSPFRSNATQAKLVYDLGRNTKFDVSVDYKHGVEGLASELGLDVLNDYRKSTNQVISTIHGIKSFGQFRFSANVSGHMNWIGIEDLNDLTRSFDQNGFYANYDFHTRWLISRRHSLILSFVRNNSVPILGTLYSGYIFSNYRLASNYNSKDYQMTSKLARLSYRYQFPYRHLFVNAQIHYGVTNSMMSYNIEYDPHYIFQTGIPLDRSIPSFGYRANADKLFRKLNLMLSLSSQLLRNRYVNSINTNLTRDINQTLLIHEMAINSTFKSPYNCVLSLRNVTNVYQLIGQPGRQSGTTNWILKLNNSWRLYDSLLLGQTLEYYSWKRLSTATKTDMVFLDAYGEWEMPKSRWTVTISLQNVLNEKKLGFVHMTDYSTNESNFNLQPLTVLGGLRFRF